MQYINGNFAKAYNREHNKTGRFWGGRFHSTVIDSDTQLLNCIIYAELNMVRNKFVDDPANWPWSSYCAHAYGEYNQVVDFHPVYLQLADTAEQRRLVYQSMVEERILEKGLFRDAAFSAGVITGSESFVKTLLDKLDCTNSYYRNRKIYPCGDQNVYSLRRSPS